MNSPKNFFKRSYKFWGVAVALGLFNLFLWGQPARCPFPEELPSVRESYSMVIGARERLSYELTPLLEQLYADVAVISIPDQRMNVLMTLTSAGADSVQGIPPERLIADQLQRSVYSKLWEEPCTYAVLNELGLSKWKLDLQLIGLKSFAVCKLTDTPLDGMVAFGWKEKTPLNPERMKRLVQINIRNLKRVYKKVTTE